MFTFCNNRNSEKSEKKLSERSLIWVIISFTDKYYRQQYKTARRIYKNSYMFQIVLN